MSMRPASPAGWRARWAACLGLLALGGCASSVDVRTLVTGRSDLMAYELRGDELDALQRSAQRLCPQGGEILRQGQRGPMNDTSANWFGRWTRQAAQAIDPPAREAQLVLLCRQAPAQMTATTAAPASSVVEVPQMAASAASGAPGINRPPSDAPRVASNLPAAAPVPVPSTPAPAPNAPPVRAAAAPAATPGRLPVGPLSAEW